MKFIDSNLFDIDSFLGELNNTFEQQKTAPLFHDAFLEDMLDSLYTIDKPKYPMVVKIPRSMEEMMAGDLTPAREFVIESPKKYGKSNIWFGDTSKGIDIHFGYINGDRRYLSEETLGDGTVHLLVTGATGSGKSVALNNIILNSTMYYAPWELEVHLSDAKIVEFRRFAITHQMPHIKTVAAAGDQSYALSMLEKLEKEMQQWNIIFSNAGVQNIKDFRKVTGLSVARKLIILDEFQFMFEQAGKDLNNVIKKLAGVIRAGRNAGYHIVLASQTLDGSLPKTILDNVKLRCCLANTVEMSNKILNNDLASTIVKKGEMYVNPKPDIPGEENTLKFAVPFQTDEMFEAQGKFLQSLGESMKLNVPMDFYNESERIYLPKYRNMLAPLKEDKDMLYFGEPSFVIDDKEKVLKVPFNNKSEENIMILGNSQDNILRHVLMLKENMIKLNGAVKNSVLVCDGSLEERCGLGEVPTIFKTFDVKSTEDEIYQSYLQMPYKFKLLLDVDTFVFKDTKFSPDSDHNFYEQFQKGSSFDTPINRSRYYYAFGVLNSDITTAKALGLDKLIGANKTKAIDRLATYTVQLASAYGFGDRKATKAEFPVTYIWILGAERLIGLGRASISRNVEQLKNVMFDAYQANVRFVITTRSLEDITPLRDAIKYYILDGVGDMASKIRCASYPESVKGILALMYTPESKRLSKFKKLLLDGEIPPEE